LPRIRFDDIDEFWNTDDVDHPCPKGAHHHERRRESDLVVYRLDRKPRLADGSESLNAAIAARLSDLPFRADGIATIAHSASIPGMSTTAGREIAAANVVR
jgi:hypothetical protein